MDYNKRWEIIEEKGQGGQGKVFRVLDKQRYDPNQLMQPVSGVVVSIVHSDKGQPNMEYFTPFKSTVSALLQMNDPRYSGALKVLHAPADAKNFDLSHDRMKREIEAMSKNLHPSLLKLIDADDEAKWYVSQFYANGTLDGRIGQFTGDLSGTLRAIRPVVEAVAELHKKGFIHRDIKPENIFIGYDNELILGDFGLVYYEDRDRSRLSLTFENVGSRDWMPLWAQGMRIEDLTPQFDVFSLAKVIYAMLSRTPFLRGWYFDDAQFNLTKMFPSVPNMKLANGLFAKCIKERKGEGLQDASELLSEIDETLGILDRDGIEINASENDVGLCRVCGKGRYHLRVNSGDANQGRLRSFGISPQGGQSFKIFACSHCGNVQMFYFDGNEIPPAWKKDGL